MFNLLTFSFISILSKGAIEKFCCCKPKTLYTFEKNVSTIASGTQKLSIDCSNLSVKGMDYLAPEISYNEFKFDAGLRKSSSFSNKLSFDFGVISFVQLLAAYLIALVC